MSARLGVELAPHVIRAVRIDGSLKPRVSVAELPWDPDKPQEAAAALRAELGPARRLGVAIDLAFLYAKHVKLPPIAPAERRRILTLEPERFFPVRAEDLVLSIREHDNLVFAMKESLLAGWIAALETLAPVDMVEPTPVALARALTKASIRDAVVLSHGHGTDIGVVELQDGRVSRVRRVHGEPAELAALVSANTASDAVAPRPTYVRSLNGDRAESLASLVPQLTLEALPPVAGVAAPYLAAYGAALGVGCDLGEALVAPELARRITRRRLRGVAVAAAACLATLLFAVASLDAYRARTLRELNAAIASLREPAAAVQVVQGEAASLAREARAVATLEAERSDPLRVLLALSERLPRDAHIQSIQGNGLEWQIDGYAKDAARLVPLLEAHPNLKGVHFLTATSRARLNDGIYDSFSLAFHYVPTP